MGAKYIPKFSVRSEASTPFPNFTTTPLCPKNSSMIYATWETKPKSKALPLTSVAQLSYKLIRAKSD